MDKKKSKYPTKGMNALASERPDVAKKIMGYKEGGMADKRSPFMGGGIAYAGGGKAMKREMYSEGTIVKKTTSVRPKKNRNDFLFQGLKKRGVKG
tara:strand:+ start:274 stop:558 length:285 start_codon:yes stop_codon:yes gene_type:complete